MRRLGVRSTKQTGRLHAPHVINSARGSVISRVIATPPSQTIQATNNNGVPKQPEVYVPEDFTLLPGQMGPIDRASPLAAEDVFRCFGCTETACQGPTGCAGMSWRLKPDGYLKEILTARVYDVAVRTPLEEATKLSEQLGNKLLLKREDLQPVFSFKLRGAYNKMAKLSKEQLARGVITSSAGNHAQGVALSAAKLGCRAIICMPVNTPEIKVANVRKLGGIVELVGESYQEAQAYAVKRAVEDGLVFVAPYDDPYTIAGQGTIADEIMRQISNPDEVDAIFVAIGGGGLIAGIALYIKALAPHIKVIGVEPCGANAMTMSLAKGKRVALSRVDAFADGVAVKLVGMETFRLCRELVDGVVLVDNSAISGAIKDVFNETRSILEPAGAVSVAGAKAYLEHNKLKGKTVVAVTSGANINFERLRLVAELANVGSHQEALFATTIPERPGSFKDFVHIAAGDSDMPVTEFRYRYAAGGNAEIWWAAGVRSADQAAEVVARLNAAGLATDDISGDEDAQEHLRYLVGGKPRTYMGALPDEKMYKISFPERPGALRRFLDELSPAFNITLFQYRNTGNRESAVLLGVQVPCTEAAAFNAAVKSLEDEYTFKELSAKTMKVFSKFIS